MKPPAKINDIERVLEKYTSERIIQLGQSVVSPMLTAEMQNITLLGTPCLGNIYFLLAK
jgi:hypothetical protein